MGLSSDIFATGMAYVAMSRVRTLAGLYLLAFDPKSIKVSRECTEEVNRLRKLFRSDIPCIELSAVPKPIKSNPKRTGLTCLPDLVHSPKSRLNPLFVIL